jgi:RNA polymerase sigma factor (sigma-70 family)
MPDRRPTAGEGAAAGGLGQDPVRLLGFCASSAPREREAGFRELGRILYTTLWRQVADRPELWHLAAESSQEALGVIWRQLQAGRGPAEPQHFVGWSVVIASNKLREALRQREPRARLLPAKRVAASRQVSLDAAPSDDQEPLGDLLAAEDRPEAEAERRLALASLLRMVAESGLISEQSRTVLLKGYLEGWDDAELAEHLGTTRGNVHVIRCRDLAKLRAEPEFMARLAQWFD